MFETTMEARDAHTIESIHKQNTRETRSCYRTKQLSNTKYDEVIREKKKDASGWPERSARDE